MQRAYPEMQIKEYPGRKHVEVLIAENQMVITDGTTWQYYEKK